MGILQDLAYFNTLAPSLPIFILYSNVFVLFLCFCKIFLFSFYIFLFFSSSSFSFFSFTCSHSYSSPQLSLACITSHYKTAHAKLRKSRKGPPKIEKPCKIKEKNTPVKLEHPPSFPNPLSTPTHLASSLSTILLSSALHLTYSFRWASHDRRSSETNYSSSNYGHRQSFGRCVA